MTNLQKKLDKRWGDEFVDRRTWPVYNEQLVKRGEFFLDLDFVEHWPQELAKMNENKVGAPFKFPNTLIEMQAVWHASGIPYRMVEGITRDLSKMCQVPDYNDYSTVNRRVNKLNYTLANLRDEALTLFSDGSSLQAIAGGEYLREKYGKKNRRWVQVIVLGDKEHHEPVSYEVRLVPESEPENTKQQVFNLLMKDVKITAVGGDGAFDAKDFWNFLHTWNIKPVIKPDKNALEDTECKPRNNDVRERNKLGFKKWSKKKGYGHRWPATEGVFSAIKRIFGEQLLATSDIGLEKEASSKVWAYQRMKRYGEA